MFVTDDAGRIPRPGEASPPVQISRTNNDRPFDLLFDSDLFDGARGADTSTQGTGIFTVSLGHDEMGCPKSGHSSFHKGGVDHICRTDFHAQPASLAEPQEIPFG